MEAVQNESQPEVVEAPKPTPMEELSKKYGMLCAQLGESTYQAKMHQDAANDMIVQLKNINLDAQKLKDKEAKAVKEEATNG